MKYAELITKDYPIIVAKTYPIDPSKEDLDAYFEEVEQFLDSTTGPYVFISYREKTVFISSEARKYIGEKAIRLNAKYSDRVMGTIVVTQGIIAAMMVKTISAIYKPLKESIIVSSLDEAFSKAKQLLK